MTANEHVPLSNVYLLFYHCWDYGDPYVVGENL